MKEVLEKMEWGGPAQDGSAGQGAGRGGKGSGVGGRAHFLGSGRGWGRWVQCIVREELPAGQCELISSHRLLQCLRASGAGKSEPGAPQRPPPASPPPQPWSSLDLRCHHSPSPTHRPPICPERKGPQSQGGQGGSKPWTVGAAGQKESEQRS